MNEDRSARANSIGNLIFKLRNLNYIKIGVHNTRTRSGGAHQEESDPSSINDSKSDEVSLVLAPSTALFYIIQSFNLSLMQNREEKET